MSNIPSSKFPLLISMLKISLNNFLLIIFLKYFFAQPLLFDTMTRTSALSSYSIKFDRYSKSLLNSYSFLTSSIPSSNANSTPLTSIASVIRLIRCWYTCTFMWYFASNICSIAWTPSSFMPSCIPSLPSSTGVMLSITLSKSNFPYSTPAK